MRIANNSSDVFTSCNDKVVCRFEGDKEVCKVTLGNHAVSMAANDQHLFVLTNQSEIVVLDAKDLSTKNQKKLTCQASAMNICGDNIWVGDKKGSLFVLDAASLDEKNKLENKHSKAVTVISSNATMVASGDAYRYFFVFNNEDHQELFASGDHKDKILDLFMND